MIRLQPKTLERIRNHFREVGQPASVSFTSPRALEDPFAGDPDAARRFDALFEVMFLMIAADGHVADEEFEVLRGAVRGLSDNAIRTAHIDKMLAECKVRYEQGKEARLLVIAPVLKEDPALTEAAFSLAAAIAFADNEIQDEENDLINELAEVLDIDSDRAEELLAQLETDSAD
jgi:tellurite resistance protein